MIGPMPRPVAIQHGAQPRAAPSAFVPGATGSESEKGLYVDYAPRGDYDCRFALIWLKASIVRQAHRFHV